MFNKVTKSFQYGQHTVTMETGKIARQASGSVLVTIDDTVVLATVVACQESKIEQNFLPLSVDYIEKTYAAGRIPGGFFKREGRPSEKEILTSRLIDRPLRPLFPKWFYNEVQIVLHTLSVNPDIDPDIPALIAASAALSISGIPFDGPIGAARVGYINNEYILNPTQSQLVFSKLNLVVAATENSVLMVESEADELSEDIMLKAIEFGHDKIQVVIDKIHELVSEAGKPEWDYQLPIQNKFLFSEIEAISHTSLEAVYKIRDKQDRVNQLNKIHSDVKKILTEKAVATGQVIPNNVTIDNILIDIRSNILRSKILRGEPRIDGRDTRTVRPIDIQLGILPRAHGSALFTRGETQALVVTTLGTKQNEQVIDALMGEYRERFMLHYNMPAFATGEIGRIGIPKRREIGHGRLAKRALLPVLPNVDAFQYTIRLVSEITESNGSSSMASVCGSSLAMMDAGVPIKDHVAGVAMGLILENEKFSILTDILGDEDFLGDMDFKVAGTINGITALQMDIKIQGITDIVIKKSLEQAKEGRLNILEEMNKSIISSRSNLSNFAPSMLTINIKPEKIRDVIGKAGTTIRNLTEETGTQIDISDDGKVTISSVDKNNAKEAQRRILELTAEVEVGQIYDGQVLRLLDFGAIIRVLPGKDGLLHISEIANYRIASIKDILSVGQQIRVKVIEADDKGRLRLSLKAVNNNEDI